MKGVSKTPSTGDSSATRRSVHTPDRIQFQSHHRQTVLCSSDVTLTLSCEEKEQSPFPSEGKVRMGSVSYIEPLTKTSEGLLGTTLIDGRCAGGIELEEIDVRDVRQNAVVEGIADELGEPLLLLLPKFVGE
jgi:hypothetical protein